MSGRIRSQTGATGATGRCHVGTVAAGIVAAVFHWLVPVEGAATAKASQLQACRAAVLPQDRIKACSQIIAKDAATAPDDLFGAYLGRAMALYGIAEYQRALADLNRAIGIKPDSAEALDRRGVLYRKLGQADEAIADHTRAISLAPQMARAYRNRGLARFFKGETDAAIEDYSAAIRIDPKYANTYENRGAAYEQLGRYGDAILDYSKTIEFMPRNADAYTNRGYAYQLNGDRDKAIADYRKAIELDPEQIQAIENLKLMTQR